jgi:hypothetical protein
MQLPGIGTTVTATPRKLMASYEGMHYMPVNAVIDADVSRDAGNTGDLDVLRAGTVLGNTATGYRPAIIGLTTVDYESGGTTLTVSAATATELSRLYGASGTDEFYVVGFDGTTAGTGTFNGVDVVGVTHSAINTTNGQITVSDLSVNFEAGAFVVAGEVIESNPIDENLLTSLTRNRLANPILVPEGYGIKVTDDDGNDVDAPLQRVLVSGMVDASQIVNYPTAADDQGVALREWLKYELNRNTMGIAFDDSFQ